MKLQNENRAKVESLNQHKRRAQLTQLRDFLHNQTQTKKDQELHQRAVEKDSDHNVFHFSSLTFLEGRRLAQACHRSNLPKP
jgi:hypothetical protein